MIERFMSKVVIERFMSKVVMCPASGCWLWCAAWDSEGYGRFAVSRGVKDRAHRVAYRLLVGGIPDGAVLDHKCRTRCCVNPAHLEPVAAVENVRRGAWFLFAKGVAA